MQETIPFYKTHAWRQCKNAYLKHARGLCERCLERGIITPAEIVHHKTYITPSNLNDPNITLNWDNLMAVCRKCHGEIHGESNRRAKQRYLVDEFGRVVACG